jgi:hypothetical protein
MKKIILILSLILTTTLVNYGQRAITDTIQGAETVTFTVINGVGQLSALCTDDFGGTSDGTLILQGSVNGTVFETVTETAGLFSFYPNDTLTIAPNAEWLVAIQKPVFNYYRVSGTGTSGDTTLITISWAKYK